MGNVYFGDMLDDFLIMYIDDLLIYSKIWEEHVIHVRKVLDWLREHELYAKPEKCEWGVTEVDFLGFKVTSEGVELDPKKVEAVIKWPTLKAVRHVHEFVGFTRFYGKHIWDYSKIAAPLTDIQKGKFCWSEIESRAFEKMVAAVFDTGHETTGV